VGRRGRRGRRRTLAPAPPSAEGSDRCVNRCSTGPRPSRRGLRFSSPAVFPAIPVHTPDDSRRPRGGAGRRAGGTAPVRPGRTRRDRSVRPSIRPAGGTAPARPDEGTVTGPARSTVSRPVLPADRVDPGYGPAIFQVRFDGSRRRPLRPLAARCRRRRGGGSFDGSRRRPLRREVGLESDLTGRYRFASIQSSARKSVSGWLPAGSAV
jgi:hypothetical protein